MRVHQECLLFMLLHIIVIEVLENIITFLYKNYLFSYKKSLFLYKKRIYSCIYMIKGIQIEEHEIKIVHFADDTSIFL